MSDEGPSRGASLLAILFVVLLIVGAIWVARSLIAGVHLQNCLASGRRDCLESSDS